MLDSQTIGLQLLDQTPFLGAVLDEDLIVTEILPKSPAAHAKLLLGDQVQHFEDRQAFIRHLRRSRIGDSLKLVVQRAGLADELTLTATLAQRDLAPQQEQGSEPIENQSLLQAVEPIVHKAAKSTVRLLHQQRTVALGCVVHAGGIILTKASAVANKDIACVLHNGTLISTHLVHTFSDHDLALLSIQASGLNPLPLTAKPPALAQMTVAVGPRDAVLGMGVVSVLQSGWQHDIGLKPRQLGGPLVTLHGDVIGINIGAKGRASHKVIPIAIIQEILSEDAVKDLLKAQP